MPEQSIEERSITDIASVIAHHRTYEGVDGYDGECDCGWTDPGDVSRGDWNHPRHLAEVLVGLGARLELERVSGNTVILRKTNAEVVAAWMESLGYSVNRESKNTLFAVLTDNSGPRITIAFGAEITYTGDPETPFTGPGVQSRMITRKPKR